MSSRLERLGVGWRIDVVRLGLSRLTTPAGPFSSSASHRLRDRRAGSGGERESDPERAHNLRCGPICGHEPDAPAPRSAVENVSKLEQAQWQQ